MRFRQSVLWAVAVLSVWPYNLAAQSITQPDPQAGNSAGVTATLYYDRAELSGQFWLKDVRIEDVSFDDSLPHRLGFSGLTADMLAVDVPVGTLQLNGTTPQNISLDATASMAASFGSITDGTGVIDGRLGIFAVTITPDGSSAPVLAGQAILAVQ